MARHPVLVTGGAGFIGSEFVRQLCRGRHRVVVVDALSYAADPARLAAVRGRFAFAKADVSNRSAVDRLLRRHRPSAVVHFAAETHVDRSILESAPFLQANVLGTQVLLDAARRYGVARFVHVSTDEVYGEIRRGAFAESSPFRPSSPYAASKAGADLLVQSYVRTFGLPAIIVRPSNNYGPWQFPEKFLPVVIAKALRNEPVPIYGRGTNVREWLHVSDCVRAIRLALERGRPGAIYNIGSGQERRNLDVAAAVLALLGKPRRLLQFVDDRPGHDARYRVDCRRLARELGWSPRIAFGEGLKTTVAWYGEHPEWLFNKTRSLRNYWRRVYRPA